MISKSIGLAVLTFLVIACTTRRGGNSAQAPPEPAIKTESQTNARLTESEVSGSGSASVDGSDPDNGYVNPQGVALQALPRALEGLYVDATKDWFHGDVALRGVAVVDGELVVAEPRRMADAELVGARFEATRVDGTTVRMRIAAVMPHENPWEGPPPGPRQRDYVLEYESKNQWVSLCPSDAPGAIPVAGSFGHTAEGNLSGNYDRSPTRLTFACRDGVAAKCQDWGYRSWEPERAPYFQACTRMARADYCGNGRSRTVDGTMINYIDLHRRPDGPVEPKAGFVPEAVWGLGNGNSPSAAICLSRTRWSTMPLGPRSPCAEILADPRDAATDGKSGRYCDDMTIKEWAEADALFINASRPLDVGLFMWSNGKGIFATTTQFPWLGKEAHSPGPPGYPEFVGIEGAIFKPEVPAPKRKGMVELVRYTRKTPTLTLEILTTKRPPPGFHRQAVEGYVFAYKQDSEPPTSTARPLNLFSDRKGHYLTTSEEQAPANSGYRKKQQIGWLPY
jgi:hypothetical protein